MSQGGLEANHLTRGQGCSPHHEPGHVVACLDNGVLCGVTTHSTTREDNNHILLSFSPEYDRGTTNSICPARMLGAFFKEEEE
jgi:hypothetical protein